MTSGGQEEVDAEFAAMQTVFTTLKSLDEDSQRRVLDYVSSRLDIQLKQAKPKPSSDIDEEDEVEDAGGTPKPTTFSSFAELHDATQPKTHPERALVAGYWLQVCEGAESFDSQSANTALKHLGLGVPNITSAIEGLKSQKPALALQLKKSGRSRQARKTYKITVAGVRAVEGMING